MFVRMVSRYFKQDSIWTLADGAVGTAGGAAFPLFDRVNSLYSVEKLAGFAKRPPILRPVQLSLVPDRVDSYVLVSDGCAIRDPLCKI